MFGWTKQLTCSLSFSGNSDIERELGRERAVWKLWMVYLGVGWVIASLAALRHPARVSRGSVDKEGNTLHVWLNNYQWIYIYRSALCILGHNNACSCQHHFHFILFLLIGILLLFFFFFIIQAFRFCMFF